MSSSFVEPPAAAGVSASVAVVATAKDAGTARLDRSYIQLFASSATAPIQWRLLGGNNRELGRGMGQFVDRESCVLGIEHLKTVVGSLEASLRRDEAGAWGWLLCLGGVPVARSGYRYDRQIRCSQGQSQFVRALGHCEISQTLTLTDSRRWAGHRRSSTEQATSAVGGSTRWPA